MSFSFKRQSLGAAFARSSSEQVCRFRSDRAHGCFDLLRQVRYLLVLDLLRQARYHPLALVRYGVHVDHVHEHSAQPHGRARQLRADFQPRRLSRWREDHVGAVRGDLAVRELFLDRRAVGVGALEQDELRVRAQRGLRGCLSPVVEDEALHHLRRTPHRDPPPLGPVVVGLRARVRGVREISHGQGGERLGRDRATGVGGLGCGQRNGGKPRT
mmetsp:Transcript_4228/g.10297  ORF Transcript_4228/g.10297 Transcript_4228/m.10297 type:complete len:214 (+) Transcript_4228:87-728(+)